MELVARKLRGSGISLLSGDGVCIFLISVFFFHRKSLGRSSVRSRMSLKPPKAYNSLQKGAVVWDPKPLQVKKIFEALKKGLK